jgi:Flp pilus assembly protein CpaB
MNRPAAPPPRTTPGWGAGARRRIPFYLLGALLLAILAGVLTYRYLEQLRNAALPTEAALVARLDIRPGTVVLPEMVEVRSVPQAVLPAGHLTDPQQAEGRVALVAIARGEVLLSERLSGGPESALSARLPDGRWAMVLPVGWLASPLPEMRVGDQIELLAYQEGEPQASAGVVVSGVEVLAIAGSDVAAERVTLAVTLQEATAILYARANGFSLLALLRPMGVQR